jgi:hypothetical protein
MSTYDKIAFTSRPTLYLSTPDTIDKSGTGAFSLSSNNLSVTGQPIIFGSELSFVMSSTTTVDVVGNPIFFNDTATFECVIFASRPTQDVSILIDDDSQNSLLLTPDGVTLKLYFESLLSKYSRTTTVKVKDWNKKLYIVVSITSTQATLSVNGIGNILTYQDTIVNSSNVTIGGGYAGYKYLIDGIAFYKKTIQNKINIIDDPYSGYSNYATRSNSGRVTNFKGYQRGIKQTIALDKAAFVKSLNGDQYIFSYLVTKIKQGLDYIIVRASDERITVSYDIDFDQSGQFTEYLLVSSVDDSNIRFIVNAADVESDFTISIETIYNGDILYETPADLELIGQALYSERSESIVNVPDGTKLPEATYVGTWILESSPKTIEIVFKPIDEGVDTYVFFSTDGFASYGPTGAISGYTAYLNGENVSDLTNIRYDQWNHLVLTHATPTATDFYLNSDDGLAPTTTISYMLLTAYPTVLGSNTITILYSILSGIDLLTASEEVVITEGMFSGGQGFNAYSYAWAILGAGGS